MLSYIVGFVAILVLFANPIVQILSPSSIKRSSSSSNVGPRPLLNESLLAIDGPNSTAPECGDSSNSGYSVRIVRREPLILYLEGFLSEIERKHLLEISETLFEPSTITHDGDLTHRDTTIRNSHVALIPRSETVRCIERRALALQGNPRDVWIERLRTQRYRPRGHYSHHFDWSANTRGWGRVSSFMAWVDASVDIEGGGTEFPLVRRPDGVGWCGGFVECPGEQDEKKETRQQQQQLVDEQGVVFKPVPGNAVYWENFAAGDGRGYDETWHAGLPVEKGVKVGLNIWSFGRIQR